MSLERFRRRWNSWNNPGCLADFPSTSVTACLTKNIGPIIFELRVEQALDSLEVVRALKPEYLGGVR